MRQTTTVMPTITGYVMPSGARIETMAMVAAEIGDAQMPICEATAAMVSGREGRTFCSLATSAMTGRVAKATWPVPQKTVMKNVTSGA